MSPRRPQLAESRLGASRRPDHCDGPADIPVTGPCRCRDRGQAAGARTAGTVAATGRRCAQPVPPAVPRA